MTENMPAMEAKEYAKKAREMGEDASKQGMAYAEKARKEAQRASESMMGGVESGAEKMSQFEKESVDFVKKAVGQVNTEPLYSYLFKKMKYQINLSIAESYNQ